MGMLMVFPLDHNSITTSLEGIGIEIGAELLKNDLREEFAQ
jgi:hypothetical protein